MRRGNGRFELRVSGLSSAFLFAITDDVPWMHWTFGAMLAFAFVLDCLLTWADDANR